jgi:hypothetical protein
VNHASDRPHPAGRSALSFVRGVPVPRMARWANRVNHWNAAISSLARASLFESPEDIINSKAEAAPRGERRYFADCLKFFRSGTGWSFLVGIR